MTSYSDRRKEARKIIVKFTLVHDLKKGVLLGYLHDLTLKGARVNGNKKQQVETPVTLSIELPEKIGVKELNIAAKVTSCVTVTEDPESYAIGFAFTELKSEQAELIEKVLERYHF